MDEASMSKEKLSQREDMVRCLQDELVKVRLTVAESDALVRDLRSRIEDLEEVWMLFMNFLPKFWLIFYQFFNGLFFNGIFSQKLILKNDKIKLKIMIKLVLANTTSLWVIAV